MTKTNTKNKTIDPQLIKQLLEHADSEQLFGKDGFFQKLAQGLVKGILNAEMEYHLGFEKNSRTDGMGYILIGYRYTQGREGDFMSQIVPKGFGFWMDLMKK